MKGGELIMTIKEKLQDRSILLISGFVLMGIFLIVTGAAMFGEWYHGWRASHEWQSPIVWQGFVKEIRNEVEAPKTDQEVIQEYKLAPIVRTIYFLESTSGKNDPCKEANMFNGYGYRQNTFENMCYDTFEEVTEKVNEWYEERLTFNGNNLAEALCFYNKGISGLNTCDYSLNFIRSLVDQL